MKPQSQKVMRLSNLLITLFCTCATAAYAAADKTASSTPDPLAILQSAGASQKDKADACRQLALTGGKEAVEPLARLLADPQLSHMARYALEPIPGNAVDKALVEALGKVDGNLLAGVIGSIGVRKNPKAVPTLATFLHYRDPVVVQAAARALGSIGGNAAIKALMEFLPKAAPDEQLAVSEGLLRAAETLVEQQKIDAAMKVYDALRKVEGAHQLRTAALRGAAMTRGENSRSMLVDALRGDDYSQAAAAARIAQFLTSPEITLAFATELPRLSPDRQILVIHALARRGDKAALPALTSLAIACPEKRVRLEAIRSLAQLGDPSIHPVLVDALGNSDADISRASQEALASLQGPAVDKAVINLINSTSAQQRLTGFDLAARRRMISAVPLLIKASADTDIQIRKAAVRRLGELASHEDLPSLLDMLSAAKAPEDIESVEQALSAVCLRAPNRDEVVQRLASPLGQARPPQKIALLRCISAVGAEKSLPYIATALQGSDPQVRAAAIRALGSLTTPAAAPQLLEVAQSASNPAERLLALRGYLGLARLGDVPEEKRLGMCQEVAGLANQPEEKRLLLAALGEQNSKGAVEAIAPYLADPAVNQEAATATISVAERMLRRADAASNASMLAATLSKAAAAAMNPDVAKRAVALAEQAKEKAAQE